MVLQNAVTHVFGNKKRIQNGWCDDHDEIQHLLNDDNLDKYA